MRKALIAIQKLPPACRRLSRALHPGEAFLAALLLGCSNHANSDPSSAAAAAASAAAANQSDTGATLASLTQSLRKYTIEHKRVPADLNELVAAGYISQLPPAPPGQKFVINPKGVQVILMKQPPQ